MLNGFSNIDVNSFFTYSCDRHTLNTRSAAEEKLVPAKAKLELRKTFFTNRIVNVWNDIPYEIRTAPSVNSFKNQYGDEYKNTNVTNYVGLIDIGS